MKITKDEHNSLRKIAIYLEGIKHGRGGNVYPLGNQDLEVLWKVIELTKNQTI